MIGLGAGGERGALFALTPPRRSTPPHRAHAAGSEESGTISTEDTGSCRTVFVGIPSPEYVIDVARRLVDDGVQLLELCGGFGPVWAGRVIEATGHAVPVGTVGYGPEAVDHVHAIFTD